MPHKPHERTSHSCTGSAAELGEATRYYVGDNESWRRIVVPIEEEVVARKVRFRWYQQVPIDGSMDAEIWAIENVYIGSNCLKHCGSHGMCGARWKEGKCMCDHGYVANNKGHCSPIRPHPTGVIERFRELSPWWKQPLGGSIATGCDVSLNQLLLFNGNGTRIAETRSLDTTDARLIHFRLQIGGKFCTPPGDHDEGVILQYSLNNGISWKLIHIFDHWHPHINPVIMEIPFSAKSPSTSFRWWQPWREEGEIRAPWGVDDVIIGRPNLLDKNFYDNFEPSRDLDRPSDTHWYDVKGGHLGNFEGCRLHDASSSSDTSLVFDAQGKVRFAETWDFFVTSAAFLQFKLIIDCTDDIISVEYSTDLGKSWQVIEEQCFPGLDFGCSHGLGTFYHRALHNGWRRHTVMLPDAIRNKEVRFRWVQYNHNDSRWAIDDIYFGSDCDWMCSGFGSCEPDDVGFSCRCDDGFQLMPHCQPDVTLPTSLKEDFNRLWSNDSRKFSLVAGNVGTTTQTHRTYDVIVDGENAEFSRGGLRLIETSPLNTSDARYVQFYIRFGGHKNEDFGHVIAQSSINNGITWETMEVLQPRSFQSRKLINIMLSKRDRHYATIFRLWQDKPHAVENEARWAIDNLVIGGRISNCEPHILKDDFSSEDNPGWLFQPGASIGSVCEEEGILMSSQLSLDGSQINPSLVFQSRNGERSLMTRDLCVTADNYMIQFRITLGCHNSSASIRDAIYFQVSLNDGVSWQLVVPHCHGNQVSETGCSDERHPASIFYPGSLKGWNLITIPLLGKNHIRDSSSVRFRWFQGFYDHADDVIVWGIDDVYIGPECEQMCNGHGYCDGENCVCDAGYEGETCCDVSTGTNPTFLMDTFDSDANQSLWLQQAGGHVTSSHCDTSLVFSRDQYVMSKPGSRILMSRDIDTRTSDFIQFYMRCSCNVAYDTDGCAMERVYFQYSSDGGLSWIVLQTLFPFHLSQSKYIVIPPPEEARSNATRFRWWVPSTSGNFSHDCSIDHVIVGAGLLELEEDFSSSQPETWLELLSSEIISVSDGTCCSLLDDCSFLKIGGKKSTSRDCGRRWAATNGVRVDPGSYIHFHITTDCDDIKNGCNELLVEYSIDLGKSWFLFEPQCRSPNPQCKAANTVSPFKSDLFNGGQRVAFILPERSWSRSTRFRWRVAANSSETIWAIDDIYVGRRCPRACSGHGRCHGGECECDNGWAGSVCDEAINQLPQQWKDNFENNVTLQWYSMLVGAVLDSSCGNMGFKNSLHFHGACSRLLLTSPMNTSEAEFIQFMFRFACQGTHPTNRDHAVVLDYTHNGGLTWNNLLELHYDEYNETRFINILLPSSAKGVGVQFRWRQLTHNGEGNDDWGLDNLVIGGRREGKLLSDSFSFAAPSQEFYLDRKDITMWLFYDNTEATSFCGHHDVILAGIVPGVEASITTWDFVAESGFIFQYTIVVLCQALQLRHQPVHVQYSTDFGDTWRYVTSQCTPYDRSCFGQEMTQPTAHYITSDWRRRTIWIPDHVIGRRLRFRFQQYLSDVVWSLKHVYVGPACPGACRGHGDCIFGPSGPQCHCDDGFSEENCVVNQLQKAYLKDTFNQTLNVTQWNVIDSGKRSIDCGELIDGVTMKFDGVGPRQAESYDFDLRDARFVQYYAVIGSPYHPTTCLPANDRVDGVILQFSSDGGITWGLLRELDFLSYTSPTHDYVSLPQEARTSLTRLRWWQPLSIDPITGLATMGEHRAGWAIDNVYIGGHEVNAPFVDEDMEEAPHDNIGPLPDQSFDFHPNGVTGVNLCHINSSSRLITWPGGNELSMEQSLTTRQLIVSSGYMIQFKIKVGCSQIINNCSRDFAVRLEFRKAPLELWSLVREECFPDSPITSSCVPFMHHKASVYSLHQSWLRVTIPLNFIESETTQFRWIQDGGAPSEYSWALDEVYIGEACHEYCSGHGRCRRGPTCVCDHGYQGEDCSTPVTPTLIRDFKDHFESPSMIEQSPAATGLKKWGIFEGGVVGYGGCGSLRPFGFGRNAYFNDCGERWIATVEMDMSMASYVQYVIQIGMTPPRSSCHVSYRGNTSRDAIVLLEYTVNNGVTWHLLEEHRAENFKKPRRVAIKLAEEMKNVHTILRWWQPRHNGKGQDQWALDNIEIIMSRVNRYMHSLREPLPRLSSRRRSEIPDRPTDGAKEQLP